MLTALSHLVVNHPFEQDIPPVGHLAILVIRLSQCRSACSQVTVILLNNGLKVQG